MSKNSLERSLSLSSSYSDDSIQFRLTIPKEYIDLLGWEKGDKILTSLVVGTESITLERDYRD